MENNGKTYLLTYDVRSFLKKLFGIDTLPGPEKNQKILLQWVQQKLQEEGSLKWVLEEKDGLLAQLGSTERFPDEYLDIIVNKAIFNRFIQPFNLACILGEEEAYRDKLPVLWKIFGNEKEIKTDTPHKRTVAWDKFLQIWGGIGSVPPNGLSDRYWAHPVLGKLPRLENYLNFYNRDPVTGELKIIPIKNRTDSDLIKLEEFPGYLKDIERAYKIDLPLLKTQRALRLFSKAQEEKKEVTEEADKPISNDYEAFIRSLRVWFQSDSEIKIQVPERPAKIYNYDSLGFRDEKTKSWRTFLDILQDPDHSYNIGPAHKISGDDKQRVKNYSNQLKRLDQINIKLGKFISKTYNRQMPKDFKIYERLKAEKPGTYGFKFQIGINTADEKIESRYDLFSKDQLRSGLKSLSDESDKYKKDPNNPEVKDDLMDAATVARKRGALTEDELRNMIKSYRTLDLESKGG
jgi:hypothetical protein